MLVHGRWLMQNSMAPRMGRLADVFAQGWQLCAGTCFVHSYKKKYNVNVQHVTFGANPSGDVVSKLKK
jgi:hypothetical protein